MSWTLDEGLSFIRSKYNKPTSTCNRLRRYLEIELCRHFGQKGGSIAIGTKARAQWQPYVDELKRMGKVQIESKKTFLIPQYYKETVLPVIEPMEEPILHTVQPQPHLERIEVVEVIKEKMKPIKPKIRKTYNEQSWQFDRFHVPFTAEERAYNREVALHNANLKTSVDKTVQYDNPAYTEWLAQQETIRQQKMKWQTVTKLRNQQLHTPIQRKPMTQSENIFNYLRDHGEDLIDTVDIIKTQHYRFDQVEFNKETKRLQKQLPIVLKPKDQSYDDFVKEAAQKKWRISSKDIIEGRYELGLKLSAASKASRTFIKEKNKRKLSEIVVDTVRKHKLRWLPNTNIDFNTILQALSQKYLTKKQYPTTKYNRIRFTRHVIELMSDMFRIAD